MDRHTLNQIAQQQVRVFSQALANAGATAATAHLFRGRVTVLSGVKQHPYDAWLYLDGKLLCSFTVKQPGEA